MKSNYGVFETLRTYGGRVFEIAPHLRRLRQSARIQGIPIRLSNSQLTHALHFLCQPSGETRLKLIATPRDIEIETKPWRLPKAIYSKGVALTTYRYTRYQPIVKSLGRAQEDCANTLAVEKGYFDALLINRQNKIPEAACGNIFYIHNDVLYTPNLAILFGITRAVVLRLAKTIIPVGHYTPTLTELITADECFITRSGTGIVPVVRINRTKIGDGKVGPVTKELMRLFHEYVEIESRRTLKKNRERRSN